ncbi:hypothetical protein [Micromonospora parathelypteridis]|uniref:DUF4287 domain-containing protein n=1 Tax=Micromonospora parathelypteridis TaxID=1839617 RepID=A0A840W848_9ACTN|nr:hypothetical protein [Micromonospora parathelypteridis]MBB5481208.1 hypothetical protein [Micromonospora parathelypteridis]
MTNQRSFKARVRTRMAKTGESYTTARRQLLNRAAQPASAAPPPPEPTPTPRPGSAAAQTERIADDLIHARSGRRWADWFALLDAAAATEWTHTQIARHLVAEHEVPGWWAQTITVGYEQARGLRAPGQQRGGGFSASASRTVAVPALRLYEAFADETARARWLPDVDVRVRTTTAPRSFRADWVGGPTRIVVGFDAVGESKTRVNVLHEKLTGAEQAAELKAYWRERLAVLKELLESNGDHR